MSQESKINSDLNAIKEWISKEPYLPQDIDDSMLQKFLHSCYGSLEKTKRCIERFCVTRATMPELYTYRDPLTDKIKTAFSITTVATNTTGDHEMLIHQLDDPTLDHYVFYDVLKAFTMQADFWLKNRDILPEGHIIVLDIKDYLLKIIPKVNVLFFKDFLIFLLEGMPVRVKQVHVVNTPSYYEKLYSLIKPVLPIDIINLITFHADGESLQKSIDKKYLPSEYGGEAGSMKQQHTEWVKMIQDHRDMFLNDNMWKADLKKKPKDTSTYNSDMSGSFRTLSID